MTWQGSGTARMLGHGCSELSSYKLFHSVLGKPLILQGSRSARMQWRCLRKRRGRFARARHICAWRPLPCMPGCPLLPNWLPLSLRLEATARYLCMWQNSFTDTLLWLCASELPA